jgi:hypothetical protein
MQCSRTAITTAVAGIPELVHDGVDGFVAQAATLPLFADAMERAWTHRNRMCEFGLKAREAIVRKQPADPVRVFVDDLISQL